MARRLEDRRLTLLDRPAEVHDHHLVGDMADHAQVVGNEEVGEGEFLLHVHRQVQHLGLDRHVKRRDRLIGDQNARLQHQRAGNRDPLALTAGVCG